MQHKVPNHHLSLPSLPPCWQPSFDFSFLIFSSSKGTVQQQLLHLIEPTRVCVVGRLSVISKYFLTRFHIHLSAEGLGGPRGEANLLTPLQPRTLTKEPFLKKPFTSTSPTSGNFMLRSRLVTRNLLSYRSSLPRNFSTTSVIMVKTGDSIPSVELTEATPGTKVNLAKELASGKGLIIGVPAAFSRSPPWPTISTLNALPPLGLLFRARGDGEWDTVAVEANIICSPFPQSTLAAVQKLQLTMFQQALPALRPMCQATSTHPN